MLVKNSEIRNVSQGLFNLGLGFVYIFDSTIDKFGDEKIEGSLVFSIPGLVEMRNTTVSNGISENGLIYISRITSIVNIDNSKLLNNTASSQGSIIFSIGNT